MNILLKHFRHFVVVVAITLSAVFDVVGQNDAGVVITARELEKVKNSLERERDAIFTEALNLSISQASDFHPIYVQYTKEKAAHDDLLMKLIVLYLDNYQKADEKFMIKFIAQSEKYYRSEQQLRKKYYKKLAKELSVQIASEFYELDDFCCAVLRLNVLSSLPFTAKFIHN